MKAFGFEITLEETKAFFDVVFMKRTSAFVVAVSAALLFAPDSFLQKIHLLFVRDKVAVVLGFIFIGGIIIFLYRCCADLYVKWKHHEYYYGRKAKERIDKLSIMGMCTLYKAYLSQAHKVTLDTTDPLATELTSKGLLKPARHGRLNRWGYYLPDWVVECLSKYWKDDIAAFEKSMRKEFKASGVGVDALYE